MTKELQKFCPLFQNLPMELVSVNDLSFSYLHISRLRTRQFQGMGGLTDNVCSFNWLNENHQDPAHPDHGRRWTKA